MPQNRQRLAVVLGIVLLLVIAAVLTGRPEEDNGTRLGQAGRIEQGARRTGQDGPAGGTTSVPVWLVPLLGLAGPAVVVVAILATNRREAARLEHERGLKEAELEETRLTKVREERLKAYAELNVLA